MAGENEEEAKEPSLAEAVGNRLVIGCFSVTALCGAVLAYGRRLGYWRTGDGGLEEWGRGPGVLFA
jgi:hypothetical protein